MLFAAFALVGCKDKPQPADKTGFEMNLTNEDSTNVINLVNTFFEYAEHGKYDEAAAMLYMDNVDSVYEEPQPLDNAHIAKVKQMLSSLPIIRHEINYVKFEQTYSNEVKCTAIIAEAKGDMPEIKTVFYFKPYDYLGSWRLCMIDSYNGDRTIINNEHQDSLTDMYNMQMRERSIKRINNKTRNNNGSSGCFIVASCLFC